MKKEKIKDRKVAFLLAGNLALAACGGAEDSYETALSDEHSNSDTTRGDVTNDLLDDPVKNELDGTLDEGKSDYDNEVVEHTDVDKPVIKSVDLITYSSIGRQSDGGLKLTQYDAVRIPNRSSGEAHGALDINNDGQTEFFLFESSTREGSLPIDNHAIILSKKIDGSFSPQFTIGEKNGWPVTVADSSIEIINGPVVSSWVQDVVVADFNGDGLNDMFFSGHGREYAEGFTGDFGELVSSKEFTDNYPGDHIQILFSGETPEVTFVTTERAFWHSARVGDLDGDGDIDIVATRFSDTNVYWNNGSGEFTKSMGPAEIHFEGIGQQYYSASALDVADISGDGRVDIIIGPQPQSFFDSTIHPNGISIFSYNTDSQTWFKSSDAKFPTFSSHTGINVDTRDFIIVDKVNTGDFDNDGDIDIIVKLHTLDQDFQTASTEILGKSTDGYFGTVVYENLGNGAFNIIHFEPLGYDHPGDGAEFIDFDGDGLLDIVSPGWPGMDNDISDIFRQIFINNGDRTFTQLSEKYNIDLAVQESQFSLEVPGVNYSISYWGIDYIDDDPVLYVNKYGQWMGENDLIFFDITVA